MIRGGSEVVRPSSCRRRVAGSCLAVLAVGIAACSETESSYQNEEIAPLPPSQGTEVVPPTASRRPSSLAGDAFDPRDWQILEERVRWAVENGLDTLPLGHAVAAVGRSFVGAPYTPGTLDPPGPEHLVVNLREFDCVTFVENVLALTAFVREHGTSALDDRPRAESTYRGYLAALRYRTPSKIEYESRIHYFSEWIGQNAARGHLSLLADELGAVADAEPIDFMSSHPESYRQMAEPGVRTAIRRMEGRLNAGAPRRYLPEDDLSRIDGVVMPGDVIAATSTIPGLDVAHTGLAVRVGDRIHLLHAPLVGDSVEISRRPLAERIRALESQDGVMAARPRPGPFFGGGRP